MAIQLTKENYYSAQADIDYMSYSQFKNFLECERQAMAIINGEYTKPKTTALLQGSYIDSYFSGELEDFKKENPELFTNKGELRAEYKKVQSIIEFIEKDTEFVNRFYRGNNQVILTCEIAGVPFKVKLDQLYSNRIVDNKLMANLEPIWDEEQHRKIPFYSKYWYIGQGAIYQEAVRQWMGVQLPYEISVVTKEDIPQKKGFRVSQEVLDKALELVIQFAPRFQQIKLGQIEPNECGKCDYYALTHQFDIFDIEDITLEDL